MNLANRIDMLLSESPREAKDIAAGAGVSPGSLSNWRKGNRSPGAEELYRLAKELKVPMEVFFGDVPVEMLLRGGPSEMTVAEVVERMESLSREARMLEAAIQKLRPSKPKSSSAPRLSERQSIVKQSGEKYDARQPKESSGQ